MSNSDAVKSGLHCLEVDGAGRDMSQEPESIQALSQDREWQMFSDANVYQYSAQITCSVTGSFAEGER